MIEAVIFLTTAALLVALSICANARFQDQARLPMQWWLSGEVTWTASRRLALAFTPVLALIVLGLVAASMVLFEAGPGDEPLKTPTLLVISLGFVAVHLLHLWLIDRTVRRSA